MGETAARHIAETEIALSPPERVLGWLRERYDGELCADGHVAGGEDALELELFSRGESLINFGLAAYGTTASILGELFRADHRAFVNRGLRLAILSNRAVSLDPRFPEILMPPETDPVDWLASLSEDELEALLTNAGLYDSGRFLVKLLRSERLAKAFDDDGLERVVPPIIFTQIDRRWAGRENAGLTAALWSFAAIAPATWRWAANLRPVFAGRLSRPAEFPHASTIASRWCPDPGELAWTEQVNATGDFDDYQVIRRALALVALGSEPHRGDAFLRSHDLAERCAAYALHPLSAEEIRAAHAKDRLFAAQEMIDNDSVWPDEATRETLHDACQDLRTNDPSEAHVTLLSRFHWRYNELEQQHPDWFADTPGD